MAEWKKVKLGDVCLENKGSYGIAASAVPFDENKYTYLRITDINDDSSLNHSDLKSVDDENAYKYLLKKMILFLQGQVQVQDEIIFLNLKKTNGFMQVS